MHTNVQAYTHIQMGFRDVEKFGRLFQYVDADGNGTLDFGEFLALMDLWCAQEGSLSAIFRCAPHAKVHTWVHSYLAVATDMLVSCAASSDSVQRACALSLLASQSQRMYKLFKHTARVIYA